MIDWVKRDFCFGDIVCVVIYNEGFDLLVFVFFCLMENMNMDILLEILIYVFNSNEDVVFDFLCWVDVGVIWYLWGGKGCKMLILVFKIVKKCLIVVIYNDDNICFVWVIFVVFVGVCKFYLDEFCKC